MSVRRGGLVGAIRGGFDPLKAQAMDWPGDVGGQDAAEDALKGERIKRGHDDDRAESCPTS
jgi:hypothetical protein